MPERVLILHERSLRSDAFDAVLLVVMLATLLACATAFWWYSGLPRLDGMLVMLGITGVILIAGLLGKAIKNASVGGQFKCVLTTDRIACECPIESQGESFNLKIEEIAFIEIKQFAGSNFGGDYYLHDLKGKEYWLTLSYGNPAARILDRLEDLNPKIELINHEVQYV